MQGFAIRGSETSALALLNAGAGSAPAAHARRPSNPSAVEMKATDPGRALDKAVRSAAEAMFEGRDVKVSGLRDEASGHFVVRIADRETGEVLHQTPPDALLRFFASGREGDNAPLVNVAV